MQRRLNFYQRKIIDMGATHRTKEMLKQAFPTLWLHWHLMHHPKSAEPELSFLDKVVPEGTVTVDVGANCGLYTRKLARLSKQVHAFEPSHRMADVLRRTSASNVRVHEVALSDHAGHAELFIPRNDRDLIHALASLEPSAIASNRSGVSINVPTARLDAIVRQDVAFVKIDVEGHEMHVLNGAIELLEHCRPVFLVEAEDRHREEATRSLFEFFESRSYRGFFIADGQARPISEFRTAAFQDTSVLLPNGGRRQGRAYVNNFFFFPPHLDGESILNG